MSVQRLGDRWLRRLSRVVGEPVVIGWASGGYTHRFATASHRHGWYDSKTGAVGWDPEHPTVHLESCYGEEWPEETRARRDRVCPVCLSWARWEDDRWRHLARADAHCLDLATGVEVWPMLNPLGVR